MKGTLYVDISDVLETYNTLQSLLSKERAHEALRRTLMDTGRKVRTIVSQEVPKQYEVSGGWAASGVGAPRAEGPLTVVIPVRGVRGGVGSVFKIAGASYNSNPSGYYRLDTVQYGPPAIRRMRKRAKAHIRARIVKGHVSVLPEAMSASMGGQPIFMMHGIAMARTRAGRKSPLVHVVDIASPQPPLNRSEPGVVKQLHDTMERRMLHHFSYLSS